MEAVYINSLIVFAMTLLFLMTYINNWFRSYRNRTVNAMQSFKFPENTSSHSETYQRNIIEEMQTLNNMNEEDSPKSLRYQENSMYSLSDRLSEKEDVQSESRHNHSSRSPQQDNNNHIIAYLKVETIYRDTLFVSCAFGVIGTILLVKGLKDHLLSYTSICLSLITPVVATITYHSKIGKMWNYRQSNAGEQVDLSQEIGYLFVAIMGLALISTYQQERYDQNADKIELYVFTSWIENVLGSVLLGFSIGLYKRIATATKPATPRYCTMHVFFFTVLSLTVTPYLKFPSVAN